MNKIKKIAKAIAIHNLRFYQVFGRTRYMKRAIKVYSRLGVVFLNGGPRFVAHDAYFDTSDRILIGGGRPL